MFRKEFHLTVKKRGLKSIFIFITSLYIKVWVNAFSAF